MPVRIQTHKQRKLPQNIKISTPIFSQYNSNVVDHTIGLETAKGTTVGYPLTIDQLEELISHQYNSIDTEVPYGLSGVKVILGNVSGKP